MLIRDEDIDYNRTFRTTLRISDLDISTSFIAKNVFRLFTCFIHGTLFILS